MKRIHEILLPLITLLILVSCQSETPSGNEIVFVDVIGRYEGECAAYTLSTAELMNREEATLSVFAASTMEAGITTSCDRISDQNLPLISASASEIIFEKRVDSITINMRYIAVSDSIVILHTTNGTSENLIFTGKRN